LIAVILALAGCKKTSSHPSGGAGGVGGLSGVSGVSAAAGIGAAAGMGAVSAAVPGCEAADATVTGSAAHAGAFSVIGQMLPCGLSMCHGGTGQAKLVLFGSKDLKATLVGKPSCEAPTMPLVDPQGGTAALNHSWLWQKLTAPDMSTDALIVQSAWGAPGTCPTTGFGSGQITGFGDRMPYGGLATLDAGPLGQIRNWICAGAPGP
jgi:hypothetical protein